MSNEIVQNSAIIPNPILVYTNRGNLVETIFRGAYAIVDSTGTIIDAKGDHQREIFARSSLKPIQALAVIESGAADAFALSSQEIALACASHNGEPQHTQLVAQWLTRLGVPETALECGILAPFDRVSAEALIQQGQKPSPLHHACSGKHAGFITLALHLGVPISGYSHAEHPAQKYITEVIARLTGIDPTTAPKGIDGCQVPVVGMPINALALAMARLSSKGKSSGTPENRVISAIRQHPYLIAGKKRFCTDFMELIQGKILVKMGADGVFSAMIPDRGWGIALKIDDGNLKAAEVALISILNKLDLLPSTQDWQPWLNPVIKNRNGENVGHWASA